MWKYQWHGNMIFSHGSTNQKGVLVAFRYGLEYKMLSPEVVDDEGRFIISHIEIQGRPYVLINYYAPNIELNQVNPIQYGLFLKHYGMCMIKIFRGMGRG